MKVDPLFVRVEHSIRSEITKKVPSAEGMTEKPAWVITVGASLCQMAQVHVSFAKDRLSPDVAKELIRGLTMVVDDMIPEIRSAIDGAMETTRK